MTGGDKLQAAVFSTMARVPFAKACECIKTHNPKWQELYNRIAQQMADEAKGKND